MLQFNHTKCEVKKTHIEVIFNSVFEAGRLAKWLDENQLKRSVIQGNASGYTINIWL